MAKEFGYCSSGCSRPQFEKQISGISSKYPNAIIIKELYSKTMTDRTELRKLLSQLEEDDTLVVYSMDRLSRDPETLLAYYKELAEKKVHLIFINQPYMNTEVFQSAFNKIVSLSSTPDDMAVKEGLLHLLTIQATRILEKSWENLQEHRSQMRDSFEQNTRAEADGIQNSPVRGKRYESRKSFMIKELIKKYNQAYYGSMNDVQTMEQIRNDMGTISRNTYYKYKKELAEKPA